MKLHDKKKLMAIGSILLLAITLLVKGPPTKIDDKFINFIYKKDIIVVLIGTLVSNMFTLNIDSFTNTLIIPILSIVFKTDLDKPIIYKNIKFNTKKIISSIVNLIVSVLTIIILFNNTKFA